MNTKEELIEFIVTRIGHIYFRPLMYGGTADGVDLLLYAYHELWAESMACRPRFEAVSRKIDDEEGCGSAGFPTHYRMTHPQATDEEAATYVILQWHKISEQLDVPVPYSDLANIFANHPKILQQARDRGIIRGFKTE